MSAKQAVGADLREMSVELVGTVCGGLTSLATIGLNYALAQWLQVDLLSMSVLFVVPAGAICGGMAAASGYYFAARVTQQMPSNKLLVNMLLVGASAWLLGQYIPYATATLEDGTALADVASFWQYFQASVESTQLTIGRTRSATTGELGSLGYAREALQLLGFIVGGFAIYAFLQNVEACQACRRYARTDKLLSSVNGERFNQVLEQANVGFPDISASASQLSGGKPISGLNLQLCTCPSCGQQWARPAIVIGVGQDANTVKLACYELSAEQASALRSAAAQPPHAKAA
jgi:hypothetical protein